MPCLVETVACSVEDVLLAKQAGIGRIELCSGIDVGGITPSIGLLKATLECGLPVIPMARARGGHFTYSEGELQTMERDVAAFREAGAPGVVFGILDDQYKIDRRASKRLIAQAEGMQIVCHRAFDDSADPFESLKALIDLGFTRVLTSGQKEDALTGADVLCKLMERADGRIEIMPGGGIRSTNAAAIVRKTGANQVHLGMFKKVGERPGMYGEPYSVLDERELYDIVAAVRSAA